MRIIRLENNNDDIINKICEWNYNWWKIKNNNSLEEVRCYFKHSLCKDNRLSQTFIMYMLMKKEEVMAYVEN